MGPEDRQFPEFLASQYGRLRQQHPETYARKVLVNRHRSLLRRLRLEARHAGRDRAEAPDPGPREELLVVREAIRRLPARLRQGPPWSSAAGAAAGSPARWRRPLPRPCPCPRTGWSGGSARGSS